jgi:hypothetical protein
VISVGARRSTDLHLQWCITHGGEGFALSKSLAGGLTDWVVAWMDGWILGACA